MRPLVTLLTDFGLRDTYVAEMKAAVYAACPEANVVDVTHLIPPQDVTAGAVALERAVRAFSAGTVHVAVVDPGVGTDRRLLHCRVRHQHLLLPDNGLITWTLRRLGDVAFAELMWRPVSSSSTFHGRDVLAPAAAMIARGETPATRPLGASAAVLLPMHVASGVDDAAVLYVDHFGNVVTNVPDTLVVERAFAVVRLGKPPAIDVRIRRTYGDVERGAAVALVGSGGLLEIAVNGGRADERFGLKPGDRIGLA